MKETDSREKILIVDDNKQNIEMLMELLNEEYRITAAVNGERAIKMAMSDTPPDLILLDIIMPGMDGYQVCSLLKNDDKTKHIPIIFITAVSEVMDSTKGFSLGAVDYITKPFHPPAVKSRVKLHLNLKRKQDLLEKYAFIDALTEIHNRRSFDKEIINKWKQANDTGQPLSILMIDVDNFKEQNDTYGHGYGDEVLRKIAIAIKKALRREEEFLARYGGDEFAVVLLGTGPENAWKLAEIIRANIDSFKIPLSESINGAYLTVSIGIATTSDQSISAQELLTNADKALYLAKQNGRNRIEKT
ncbi:MAG: diguanylate cyclase [Syntrophomonadaceae bacterium]|nr:diguanylate cyclase [Syntrophomonadaceae bacterium]